MSYSFRVTKPTKGEAIVAVRRALDVVVEQQPVHVRDHVQACSAAIDLINLLHPYVAKDIDVSMNGWISTDQQGAIVGVSVNVSVGLSDPKMEAAA